MLSVPLQLASLLNISFKVTGGYVYCCKIAVKVSVVTCALCQVLCFSCGRPSKTRSSPKKMVCFLFPSLGCQLNNFEFSVNFYCYLVNWLNHQRRDQRMCEMCVSAYASYLCWWLTGSGVAEEAARHAARDETRSQAQAHLHVL